MTDPSNRTIYLLGQYAANLCTEAEADELFDIIRAAQEDETLYRFLQEEWNKLQPLPGSKEPDWNNIYQSIVTHNEHEDTRRVIPLYKRSAFKWIAAASIIIIIATTAIVISNQWSRKAGGTIGEKSPSHDVPAPTETRAVITLANGQKVYLDSVNNGTIAQENNVDVVKNNNGEIIYQGSANGDQRPATSPIYNTLFNPRGSKVISLTLSDGTKVWLNSESSLKYPIAFNGNTREVEITGEAYFEVKHDAKQPFKVHLPNGSIVEDIGTSFNINAYPDEDATKTTLIEGSVKVTSSRSQVTLKPGQQAAINTFNLQLLTFNNADLEETLAWKNNQFIFNRQDIKSIMRQIARWYDVEVYYSGMSSGATFSGIVSRGSNVSQVLNIMEQAGIKFTIEGKKITVLK